MGWIAPIAPFSIDHDQAVGRSDGAGRAESSAARFQASKHWGLIYVTKQDLAARANGGPSAKGQGPLRFFFAGRIWRPPAMDAGRACRRLSRPAPLTFAALLSLLTSLQVYSDGDGLGAEDARVPSGSRLI